MDNDSEIYNFSKMTLDDLKKLTFVQCKPGAILLSVYIQPNASETMIVGLHDNRLKIKIASLPIDGRANKALCDFIAKKFMAPKKMVTILNGESSRIKTLRIEI